MPKEWIELWNAMHAVQDLPDEWVETTESMYDEMLSTLPPRAMNTVGFLVGEADHHNAENEPVYASDGRYFAAYRTVAQFKGMKR
jgi:hypothetical protein